MELSLVEVITEAMEVGVSSSSVAVGFSWFDSFALCDGVNGGSSSRL